MDSKRALYRLLQLALNEIRHEARTGGDLKNIAALSDLFHNLPLALCQNPTDYDQILRDLTENASPNKSLSTWLAENSKFQSKSPPTAAKRLSAKLGSRTCRGSWNP